MLKFRLYLDPEGSAGGQPAAPAPEPSPTPAAVITPAAPPAAGEPAAPIATPAPSPAAPGAEAPPAATPDTRIIATMPPPGTPEYFAAFEALSMEDKRKVEAEVMAITRGEAEAPKAADPAAPAPVAGEPDWKPGDAPFITDEEIAILPERQKETFLKMQQTLDEVAPLLSEDFQRGFKNFSEDPVIKERISQIQNGQLFDVTGILMGYNPEVAGKIEDLTAIDPNMNPDEFASAVESRDKKVFEDGVRKGRNAGLLEARKEVQTIEIRGRIEQGFSSLAEKHPELKGEGKWAVDATHPANNFYKYLIEKKLSDAFLLDKGGFESAYAAFLASNGALDGNIQKHVQNERFKFIRNISEAQKTEAKVLGRGTPAGSLVNANPLIPGVDVDRYMTDQAYARAKFDESDLPTKRRLEQLKAGKLQKTTV